MYPVRFIGTLLLILLSLVFSGATHVELPHGHPEEDLVERHRGRKARVHQ